MTFIFRLLRHGIKLDYHTVIEIFFNLGIETNSSAAHADTTPLRFATRAAAAGFLAANQAHLEQLRMQWV